MCQPLAMRGKAVFAVLVTLFLMTPVQAGDVSAQQQSQDEDPRQPSANNTTLYIWADGMNQFWSHFNSSDDEGMGDNGAGEIREQKGAEECECLRKVAARLRVTSGTLRSGNPPLRGDRRQRETCSRDAKSVGHFSIYRRSPFDRDQNVDRSVSCEVVGKTVGRKEALRAVTVCASEAERRDGSSTIVFPWEIKGTRLGMSAQFALPGTCKKCARLQESARSR